MFDYRHVQETLTTDNQGKRLGSSQKIMAMASFAFFKPTKTRYTLKGAPTPTSTNNAFVAAGVLLCQPEKPTPAQCGGEYGIL